VKPRSVSLCALSLLLAIAAAHAAEDGALRRNVEFLADPALEGRLTGSPGGDRAAAWLVERLAQLGAVPLPGQDDLLLEFEFTAGTRDAGSTIALNAAGASGDAAGEAASWTGTDDVQALSFSDNGTVSGPVVFAGYGLSLPDDESHGYDSYVGLDVEGKIVLVLRYVPEDVEQDERATLARYSGLRYKALNARERGASAIVMVTGPRSPNAGETIPMFFDTALSGSGIVAASISGRVADRIFERLDDRTLEQAQQALDDGNPHVAGFEIPGLELTLEVAVERERKVAANVVGMLPATDKSADGDDGNAVVLGAHLDHLGHGKHGNSLARKEEEGQIHRGADDNASGVAAVLAVGEQLARAERPRPVVLAFWAGEELGLLGSSEFVKGDYLPADAIHAYVNFDMVGRMKENKLSLQAVGSSSVWPRLIEQTNVVVGFDVAPQEDPYLPTDATSFYQAEVPTINFFTGSHEDYHRPTDTPERINYDDLERVVRFATLFTKKLSALEERPDYLEVVSKRDDLGGRDAMRAFTGTIPDYTTEVDGLRLSGVMGGGPADEAGLTEGDVIVEFAGQEIHNIYDYTYALEAVKIGEPVQVVFLRDGERREVAITPTSRK
jgi:hypothetical protein